MPKSTSLYRALNLYHEPYFAASSARESSAAEELGAHRLFVPVQLNGVDLIGKVTYIQTRDVFSRTLILLLGWQIVMVRPCIFVLVARKGLVA